MNASTDNGSKKPSRTWITPDQHVRGWQNTPNFMKAFPTRMDRRAFYARRQLFYQHVQMGLARNRSKDLRRYCEGIVKEERRYLL